MSIHSVSISYPPIAPLEGDRPRPFWSVMIPTYNRTRYLAQTLQSVLMQDPGPDQMQIEVVDNHSDTPDVQQMVADIGKGRIQFFQHDRNLGMAGNLNACINRSRGKWVHLLHDDDYVLPGFYAAMRQGIDSAPESRMGLARHTIVDEDGHWKRISALIAREPSVISDWIDRIFVKQCVQFPAIVVQRDAYAQVGGFSMDLVYALDWEMWARLSLRGAMWFEPQILACYREHGNSETSRLSQSAGTIRDAAKAIDAMYGYSPADKRAMFYRTAKRNLANDSLKRADLFLKKNLRAAAFRHAREAIGLAPTPAIVAGAISRMIRCTFAQKTE